MLGSYLLGDVLRFPVAASLNLALSATGQRIRVRPSVALAFLNEALVHERVEIWIESAVMDVFVVVVLKLVFDPQSVWFVETNNDDEEITLKACQVLYVSL